MWQPQDAVHQSLQGIENGFVLYAGEETFTFRLTDGQYLLTEARLPGVTVSTVFEDAAPDNILGYWYNDGARCALYRSSPISAADFNLRLFPRTVDEVLSVNLLSAALAGGAHCLSFREDRSAVSNIGKSTVPVYSAPFASAWRASKGKAAVSLRDSLTLLRGYTAADGSGWTCILYEVSDRTSRIGWVQNSLLGKAALSAPPDEIAVRMLRVDVHAARPTFLTDDPLVSQYGQFSVPSGTPFTCMGLFGSDWAYVAAHVSNGAFTKDGAVVWGFIPLRDLTLPAPVLCPDVMAQLEGIWHFTAGGSMAEEVLYLHADGTYEGTNPAYSADDPVLPPLTRGSWYVTPYDRVQNKYWSDAKYEVTFLHADGTANVKALTLCENAFSLTNAEGGGGYEPLFP